LRACNSPSTKIPRRTPKGKGTSTENAAKTRISEIGGAKSGALAGDGVFSDPDLARIVSTWPDLPQNIKGAVLALVNIVPRQASSNAGGVQ
jgi:hypothetical protein